MGYPMTSVVGLVLVAMTGLTITNHYQQRNQNTATGTTTATARDDDLWLQSDSARELEKALATEDEALWASYERLKKHPRNSKANPRQTKDERVDPMVLVNSVYSLNTKSELVAGIDDGTEFVVRENHQRGPTASAEDANSQQATTTMGAAAEADVAQEDRPFDFYDPTLTVGRKRDYVKKVPYFST